MVSAVHDDEAVFSNAVPILAQRESQRTSTPGAEATAKPYTMDIDSLQEAMKSHEQLWQSRDQRVKVLSNLSNPWPTVAPTHRPVPRDLPEADDAPIPHAVFRARLAAIPIGNDKKARSVLSAQLLRCQVPKDILRVVAYALVASPATRDYLFQVYDPVMRALFRCRNNVDDQTVLNTLSAIYSRYESFGIPISPQFLMLGLKFAARARSLRMMKKYLKALRASEFGMNSHVFRSVIAKCSIGHRGLGEIRNGRWLRSELQQVCTGFDDCRYLPPEQQYHLATFLEREEWQYLHGWIAILARCKDSQTIWHEWQLWKRHPARLHPKNLASTTSRVKTTKSRGEYWFIEQMAYSGGIKEAWLILADSGHEVATINPRIMGHMLEGVQHCTIFDPIPTAGGQRVAHPTVRRELLRKYDTDLLRVETAFGVRWVPSGEPPDDAQGSHVLVEDQEAALERLGANDWKLEEDFGYPYETSPMAKLEERGLHDAAETTPVDM